MYCVYILRCADKTYYTGITTDVDRRVVEHNTSPLGARYTRGRRPVTLVYVQSYVDRSAAAREEVRIKKLSRREKMALLSTR